MLSQDEIFQYLVGLPDSEYTDMVFRAESSRHDRVQDALAEELPAADDRDAVAGWLARKHLAIDPGLAEIYYLHAAPAGEIRFIEVNRLLPIVDPIAGRLSFIDFGLDIDGLDFALSVIDVTPDQWQRIVDGSLHLPEGWAASPYTVFRRGAA